MAKIKAAIPPITFNRNAVPNNKSLFSGVFINSLFKIASIPKEAINPNKPTKAVA